MKSKLTLPFVWSQDSSEIKSLPELLKTEEKSIKQLLFANGAILFKSFGIDNALKLEESVNAFSGK